MDTKTLFVFAKRIISSCPESKAKLSLKQLRDLLSEQGADPECIVLLNKMMDSFPEMKEMRDKSVWTRNDVEVAVRRAEERRRREAMAREYSRCR